MTIVTVTMNPTLDVATSVAVVEPGVELEGTAPLVNLRAGGINVARVARRFGANVAAIITTGGLAGERVRDLAARQGIDVRAVPIAEPTRESLTVTQRSDGAPFRFLLPGPRITPAEEAAVLRAVTALEAASCLAHCGSLPPGTSGPFLVSLGGAAARLGARFIVDGPGEILAGARGAFLLKPNLAELEAMAGRSLPTRSDQVQFAHKIVANGTAQNVLVSLGEAGAHLVTGAQVITYEAPSVKVVGPFGAGDSMVGALMAALDSGAALPDAVAYGVAAGSAALLTPGAELCHPAQAMRLYGEVQRRPPEPV